MKNCIVTPTFSGHFVYVRDYLKSFSKLAMDKDNFEICFTISKHEASAFNKIIAPFSDLHIRVLFFEDILAKFNIKYTPEELLSKYKKYSFQTLKKFYTMLYLGKDYRFLVLDSESILFYRCNINNLFDNFFTNPFIAYSDMDKRHRTADFMRDIKLNTAFILQSNKIQSLWFLENFVWFYDYKILADLFKEHGSPFEVINKVFDDAHNLRVTGVFEIDLYQSFIYLHHKKYGYNLIDTDSMLDKILNPYLYRESLLKKYWGNCGLLENTTSLLNVANIKDFAKLFKDNNFNIIRVNETSVNNYYYQKEFLQLVRPYILAASQDHIFGVKDTFKRRILCILQYNKLEKIKFHMKLFIKPIANFLHWLYQPIYLVINIIIFVPKFVITFLTNIKFIFKR